MVKLIYENVVFRVEPIGPELLLNAHGYLVEPGGHVVVVLGNRILGVVEVGEGLVNVVNRFL